MEGLLVCVSLGSEPLPLGCSQQLHHSNTQALQKTVCKYRFISKAVRENKIVHANTFSPVCWFTPLITAPAQTGLKSGGRNAVPASYMGSRDPVTGGNSAASPGADKQVTGVRT